MQRQAEWWLVGSNWSSWGVFKKFLCSNSTNGKPYPSIPIYYSSFFCSSSQSLHFTPSCIQFFLWLLLDLHCIHPRPIPISPKSYLLLPSSCSWDWHASKVLDTIYQQYKSKAAAAKELEELTELEYRAKLDQLIREKKIKQEAANFYFLEQQNAAFLHTEFGVEVYQKRQNRRVADPETVIEHEQAKLRHAQLKFQQEGDSGQDHLEYIQLKSDAIKHQVVDRGRKYFDSFDKDIAGYPTKPVSFTDFVDVKARMSLGTTLYGSVVQTPAIHQYHDALDPSPLPKEAPPPSFADYNTMHPDRLGYFITYYDAYRLKQPPESPFRDYQIERPSFFQVMSFYPTYTLDGNYVWTPTKDPFEQAIDPSRANLWGKKLGRAKFYYLYWFMYGLLRPTTHVYITMTLLSIMWLGSKVGKFAPEWSEAVDMAHDYSLALNTYLPVMPF